MLALKTFVASLLRGGREPRHLFLAVVLGFTAGSVCGWNLTFAALVCLATLLNCSTLHLLFFALCGGVATSCLPGVAHSLGVLLLDKFGLGAQLAKLGDGPFVALFRLDDYAVCGGLAAGLALSVPAARVFSRYMTHRRSLLNLTVARLTTTREPLLRPLGFAAATCCAMATGVLVQLQGPALVREGLLEHLSAALGTEVSADVVSYDLWSGDLQLTNLRIADVNKPTDVALVVEGVAARVQPGLLLRGRLACDEMTVAGLFCDPTKLTPAAPAGMFAGGPTLLKEDFAQPTHNEDPLRAIEVQGLVGNWSGVCDRLSVLERLVGFVEKFADLEADIAVNPALKKCVDRRRPQRDSISGALIPLAHVKNIKIERLPSSWKLSARSSLELTDLTSNPKLASRSAGLAFHDAERRVSLNTVFDLTSTERRHQVTLTAQEVALESLIASHAARSALEPLHDVATSVEAEGWVTRDNLALELTTSLKGVQLSKSSGQFAGIDGAVWRQGLQKFGGLPLEASLRGRWSNPKLTIVPAEIVHVFKQKLQAAGATEFAKAFETNKAAFSTAPALAETKTPPATATTLAAPKPSALQPAATAPAVTSLSSGIGAKTSPLQPPMQPLTIQPMAMSGSLFPPTPTATATLTPAASATALTSAAANLDGAAQPTPPVAPKTIAPTTTAVAAQPSPLQSAGSQPSESLVKTSASSNSSIAMAADTATDAPSLSSTKKPNEGSLTGSPLKPAAPTQLTASAQASAGAQAPTAPLKTLPKDPFAVVPGQPWKEPTVVQGTPVPAVPSIVAKTTAAGVQDLAAKELADRYKTAQTVTTPAATSPNSLTQPASSAPATASKPATTDVATDNAASKKTADASPSTASASTASASQSTAANVASASPSGQTAATSKNLQPAGAAPIPTTLDSTAGLRQPLSVLDPSAAPGPINMTVGYDSDRSLAATSEAAPQVARNHAKPKLPQFEELPQVSRDSQTTSRDTTATRQVVKPRVEVIDPSADGPSEQVAGPKTTSRPATSRPATSQSATSQSTMAQPATVQPKIASRPNSTPKTAPKPVRPPIADPIAVDDSFEGELQDAPPAKRKSLMGTVSGWFGRGPKPDAVIVDRDAALPYDSESAPVYEEPKSAEKPKSNKKFLSKLKSIFGEQAEVEMLPPNDVDRRVVPSTGRDDDATKVEPSSFDDTTSSPKRVAAPAEFTTDDADETSAPKAVSAFRAAAPRGTTLRGATEPRALNLPRTELSSRGEPKPLAESTELAAPAEAEPPQPNDEGPTPTAKKTAAPRNTAKPTERISAGESFYNRMVR